MRKVIVVYIDEEGVSEMAAHILDGSLDQYGPSLTVGSSINGVRIPMLGRDGRVESNES